MKLLVISDTHKILSPIKDLLQFVHSSFDMVFHLGDCYDDILSFERSYPNIRFHYVRGNCDFNFSGSIADDKIISVCGKKIWMTHGHKYSIKLSYDRISYAAQEKEVDVCLFGHTHYPAIFSYDKVLFMNPGSMAMPRGYPAASYGVLDITDEGLITPQLVGIYGRKMYRTIDI